MSEPPKFFFVSDLHGDHVTDGFSRMRDIEDSLANVVDHMLVERGGDPDAQPMGLVFTGDLTDPDKPETLRAINMLGRQCGRLAEAGIPTLMIPGNHDVVEDGLGTHTLMPLEGISPLIQVVDRPRSVRFLGRVFECLPFCPTSHDYDPAEHLRTSFLDNSEPVDFIIGHLNIEGIVPGSETTQMPRGRNVYFPLREAADFVRRDKTILVNGHYHEAQAFEYEPGIAIHIPGSLARLTHGEEKLTPRYMEIQCVDR